MISDIRAINIYNSIRCIGVKTQKSTHLLGILQQKRWIPGNQRERILEKGRTLQRWWHNKNSLLQQCTLQWHAIFQQRICTARKISKVLVLRMTHGKWRETKQQPSMLPGPAMRGCCLVSFCFLCDIHSIHFIYFLTGTTISFATLAVGARNKEEGTKEEERSLWHFSAEWCEMPFWCLINIITRVGILHRNGQQFDPYPTRCIRVCRMAHRKWKETKQQPGTTSQATCLAAA